MKVYCPNKRKKEMNLFCLYKINCKRKEKNEKKKMKRKNDYVHCTSEICSDKQANKRKSFLKSSQKEI